MDAHVGAGDTPGPGEYDAARPGEGILGGGPAFTMGGGAAGPAPGTRPRPRAPARTRWAETRRAGTRRRSRCTPASPTSRGRGWPRARPARARTTSRGPRQAPRAAPRTRRRAGAVTRADAQGPRGLGGFRGPGSAGKHSPGPAAYVSDAVARPHSAAPAYTMAARPSSPRDDVLGSTPGPGEYHADADADAEEAAFGSGGVRRRGRSPSRRKGATFGARPAHGGALSHLGESASKPGPGQYHDMHFPSAARDRGPAFTIREKLASREDGFGAERRAGTGASTTASTAKTTWRFSPGSAAA